MLDKNLVGKRKMLGLTTIVKGRLRGMSRKRKKTAKNGILMLQNKNSVLSFGGGSIFTKYGTIGVKVHSAQSRIRPELGKKIGVLTLTDLVKKDISSLVKQAKIAGIEPVELPKAPKAVKKVATKKVAAKKTATKKVAAKSRGKRNK